LVWRIGLELAIKDVVGNGTAGTAIHRQATPPRSSTQTLCPHEPLNAVQPAFVTNGQHVVPDPPCPIGSVAANKALAHLDAQHLIDNAAQAPGSSQPRIEAAS
jgi:hypothetical protein